MENTFASAYNNSSGETVTAGKYEYKCLTEKVEKTNGKSNCIYTMYTAFTDDRCIMVKWVVNDVGEAGLSGFIDRDTVKSFMETIELDPDAFELPGEHTDKESGFVCDDNALEYSGFETVTVGENCDLSGEAIFKDMSAATEITIADGALSCSYLYLDGVYTGDRTDICLPAFNKYKDTAWIAPEAFKGIPSDVIGVILLVIYFVGGGSPTAAEIKIYYLQKVYALIFIGIWESCIRIGLIKSNTGYRELFERSGVNAVLISLDEEIVYRCADYSEPPEDGDHIIRRKPIQGGI